MFSILSMLSMTKKRGHAAQEIPFIADVVRTTHEVVEKE